MTKCQVNPFPGGFIKPLQLEGASPAELSQSVSYLELLEKFDKTRGSFAPRDVFDASYMPKYIRKRVS